MRNVGWKTAASFRSLQFFIFHFSFFIVPAVAVLLIAATAHAQVIETPPDNEAPWGQDVSGFMVISLGLLYLPKFDVEAHSTQDDFIYTPRLGSAAFPNFSAHLSLIPAFGDNGVALEGGYEMMSVRWRQNVSTDADDFSGKSTLALSFMSLSVNYLRYFLGGDDRIYLLAGGGYMLERARLSAETGDDGNTDDATFPNWRLNSGFGYLHQTHSGAIGAELRADFPLLRSNLELNDPFGPFEAELTHPVVLRLCVTLMVGRLRPTRAGAE